MAISKFKHVTEWRVDIQEFNDGGFGTLNGIFKAPNSTLKKYLVEDPKTKTLIPDVNTIFKEMCEKIIQAIRAYANILQQIRFTWLPLELQEELRIVVYKKVDESIRNRTIHEILNPAGINVGAYQISQDTATWSLLKEYLGYEAVTVLDTCGILDYEVVSEPELIAKTSEGNILLLGWIDINKFPELY